MNGPVATGSAVSALTHSLCSSTARLSATQGQLLMLLLMSAFLHLPHTVLPGWLSIGAQYLFFVFCFLSFCYFLGCSCGIWRFPG